MPKMELIKKLKDDPLSKVYLVSINAKLFVQKIVPVVFIHEFYKQKYLAGVCKSVKIPRVYSIKKQGKIAYCLMEYIPHKKVKSESVVLKVISKFHKDTQNVRSNCFVRYDFNRFYQDFLVAKSYLPKVLLGMSKSELCAFFKPVFASKYSIVHGDFHEDQVFKSDKYCLIDFISAFYGPSVLDFAYFFKYAKPKGRRWNTMFFRKALIAIIIFDIAWLINRRKYEHIPSKQISNASRVILKNLKKISLR